VENLHLRYIKIYMRIIWKASGSGSYKISLSSWLETKEDKSFKYGYVQFVAVCRKCILNKKILLLCDAAASAEGVTKNAAAQEFEQLLMRKAQELKQEIEGTCIFLIGMMGSGKSTVGRLLAEALEYQFLDSDTVIESYAGGLSVAEIFKKWKEERFRELESQALQELSSAGEVVVATGGGAVVQPRNW
jgi:hypothetical protein